MKNIVDELVLIYKDGAGMITYPPLQKCSIVSSHPIVVNYKTGEIAGNELRYNYDSNGDGVMDSTIVRVSYISNEDNTGE